MKASTTGPGGTFIIRTTDQGKTWVVVQMPFETAVWSGSSYREARSQHAAHVLGIDIKVARKMGNA